MPLCLHQARRMAALRAQRPPLPLGKGALTPKLMAVPLTSVLDFNILWRLQCTASCRGLWQCFASYWPGCPIVKVALEAMLEAWQTSWRA